MPSGEEEHRARRIGVRISPDEWTVEWRTVNALVSTTAYTFTLGPDAQYLLDAGYVRIGLDHFALPGDRLAIARQDGRLKRNFQGYTDDSADTLIGLGASAIGRMPQGFVQNAVPTRNYLARIAEGRLAPGNNDVRQET